jgi:branched-chain amino acid transport system ATP-binding protein
MNTKNKILEVIDLKKSFPGVIPVNHISFQIKSQDITAIIGPNGAGKSTLFNCISGGLLLDSGQVFFQGIDITHKPSWRVIEMGLSRCFQVPRIFLDLTVRENILSALISYDRIQKKCFGLKKFLNPYKAFKTEIIKSLKEVYLETMLEKKAGALSHGDKKKLELAMGLVFKPKFLLLDEPTAGMSPRETLTTVELIRELCKEHILTVLITEHKMDVIFSIADYVHVLNRGQIIASGTINEIRSNQLVKDVYLGKEVC